MVAAAIELNMRRAITMTSKTTMIPAAAVAIRHPNGFSGPNAAIPAPINHLPSGGCATKSPTRVKLFTSPPAKLLSGAHSDS
jgi:hypothetical protein